MARMAWSTASDPRDTFVTVRLSATEAAALDAIVRARKQSRSSLVREAIGLLAAQHAAPASTPAPSTPAPTTSAAP